MRTTLSLILFALIASFFCRPTGYASASSLSGGGSSVSVIPACPVTDILFDYRADSFGVEGTGNSLAANATWTDLSSNGNNATMYGQPYIIPGYLNGHNAIYFSGAQNNNASGEGVTLPTSFTGAVTNISLFFVGRQNYVNASTGYLAYLGSNGNPNIQFYLNSGTTLVNAYRCNNNNSTLIPNESWRTFGFTSSSVATTIYDGTNYQKVNAGSAGSVTAGSFCFSNNGNGSFDGQYMAEAICFNHALSSGEVGEVQQWLKGIYNLDPTRKSNLVVCDIDSLTESLGSYSTSQATNGQGYPEMLEDQLPSSYEVKVSAVSGSETSAAVTSSGVVALNQLRAQYARAYYVGIGGINDLLDATSNSLPANIEANLQTLWLKEKSAGFSVIANTIMPSNGFSVTQNNNRLTVNTWINANAVQNGYADYVVDLASATNLSSVSTTYFYNNGPHLTGFGYQIVANLEAAAIKGIAGSTQIMDYSGLVTLSSGTASVTINPICWGNNSWADVALKTVNGVPGSIQCIPSGSPVSILTLNSLVAAAGVTTLQTLDNGTYLINTRSPTTGN